MGVSYKTAFRWWQAGKLDAYQLDKRRAEKIKQCVEHAMQEDD